MTTQNTAAKERLDEKSVNGDVVNKDCVKNQKSDFVQKLGRRYKVNVAWQLVDKNSQSQALTDEVLAMQMIFLYQLWFDFVTNHGTV